MLGSPSPATASLFTAPASASPTTTTRSGRLRGLSYLRSYTYNHLSSSRPTNLTRSTSTPAPDSPAATNTEYEQSLTGGTPSATIHSGENGWIPTIRGRSGLDRESLYPTSTSIESASQEPSLNTAGMTRSRAATTLGPTATADRPSGRRQSAADGIPSMDPFATPDQPTTANAGLQNLPSIRFIPHVEARSSRPSLQFPAISRTLKNVNGIVRVGRYSERDNNSGDQNLLPVGFKSKVVSRRHCEFWCTDGQWYIKDVKSSSGTFLNHVRLSSPGAESRPFPVNDGDVVQLGIDFKGGEEVIFRCVKIRIECNRNWQKGLNSFNTSAHKRLFKSSVKTKKRDSDAASVNNSECSICLNPVAPCQALFVAPCSHVWHYKCVRNLIVGPTWPNFLCPNCRFVADLEADVEQPEEEELYEGEDENDENEEGPWEDGLPETGAEGDESGRSASPDEQQQQQQHHLGAGDEELADLISQTSLEQQQPIGEPTRGSAPIPITQQQQQHQPNQQQQQPHQRPTDSTAPPRSTTPPSSAPFSLSAGIIVDGPMTPRNDAGPFVFDGGAGRERTTTGSTAGILAQALSEEDDDNNNNEQEGGRQQQQQQR